jgi:hypothetical protein
VLLSPAAPSVAQAPGRGDPVVKVESSARANTGRTRDRDHDGLSDARERRLRLNPRRRDTDRDGLSDGFEVKRSHTSARRADTDGDTLGDGTELKRLHTNPRSADSDGDALGDGFERRMFFTNPLRVDTDGDGLSDRREALQLGTNARSDDSDGDGLSDGVEVAAGEDPLRPPAFGPTVFVDPNSVGGACSDARSAGQARNRATPWCTAQHAAAAAPAGGMVKLRRGTYRDVNITGVARTAFAYFEPYEPEASGVRLEGLTVDGSRFLSFRRLEITGPGKRVTIAGGSSQLEFAENEIHDLQTGFYMRDGGDNISILGNHLERMIWQNLGVKDGYGIVQVTGAWNNIRAIDNHINGTDGDALQLGGLDDSVVAGNLIENVRVSPGNDDHADAIQVSGSMTNSVIARNRIRAANKAIIFGSAVQRVRTNIRVENNLISDVSTQCMNLYDTTPLIIRHNTCWDTGYGFWLRDESGSPDTHTTGAKVYNNIFGPATRAPYSVNNEVAGFSDWGSEDHNLIAEAISSQRFSSTDIVKPPPSRLARVLSSPATGNFHPRSGGLAVDAGVRRAGDPGSDLSGEVRLSGAAPDLGAFELLRHLDGTRPALKLGGKRTQRVRRFLVIVVGCPREPCLGSATGTFRLRGHGRRYRIRSRVFAVRAGHRARVRLRLSRGTRAALRRALRARRRIRVRVAVVVHDAAGNRSRGRRTVKLRR